MADAVKSGAPAGAGARGVKTAGARKSGGAKKSGAKMPAGALPFASLAKSRGGGGADAGGRYNGDSRRLSLPKRFAGRKVDLAVVGGALVAGGRGEFACHPTQHFVTVPVGVVPVPAGEKVTLAVVPVPAGVPKSTDAVAYKLPAGGAKKSGAKKSGGRAKKSGGADAGAPDGGAETAPVAPAGAGGAEAQ